MKGLIDLARKKLKDPLKPVEPELKQCAVCGTVLGVFGLDKRYKYCSDECAKIAEREYKRRYRAEHPEEEREYQRHYYERHREEISARRKAKRAVLKAA